MTFFRKKEENSAEVAMKRNNIIIGIVKEEFNVDMNSQLRDLVRIQTIIGLFTSSSPEDWKSALKKLGLDTTSKNIALAEEVYVKIRALDLQSKK